MKNKNEKKCQTKGKWVKKQNKKKHAGENDACYVTGINKNKWSTKMKLKRT